MTKIILGAAPLTLAQLRAVLDGHADIRHARQLSTQRAPTERVALDNSAELGKGCHVSTGRWDCRVQHSAFDESR